MYTTDGDLFAERLPDSSARAWFPAWRMPQRGEARWSRIRHSSPWACRRCWPTSRRLPGCCPATPAVASATGASFAASATSPENLLSAGVVGGALGALLLLVTPTSIFRAARPGSDLSRVRTARPSAALGASLQRRPGAGGNGLLIPFATTMLCAVYGVSFFGAGLRSGPARRARDGARRRHAVGGRVEGSGLPCSPTLPGWQSSFAARWHGRSPLLAVGAFLGGRMGSAIARRMPAQTLRMVVLILGFGIALLLAVRTYL